MAEAMLQSLRATVRDSLTLDGAVARHDSRVPSSSKMEATVHPSFERHVSKHTILCAQLAPVLLVVISLLQPFGDNVTPYFSCALAITIRLSRATSNEAQTNVLVSALELVRAARKLLCDFKSLKDNSMTHLKRMRLDITL